MLEVRSPPAVPAFTPVPVRARKDGWTEERQRTFIRVLAQTRCIDAAARAAGMSRESAYRLRRRKGAASFAAAWDSIFADRPRGTTSLELTWHRMIEKVGGPGARVRREAEDEIPPDPFKEALHRMMSGAAGNRRRSGRSQ